MRFLLSSLFLSCVVVMLRAAITDPNFAEDRTVIVHLFEWNWVDVAAECERFLGPHKYGGVQVSSPIEHRYYPDQDYPWWQRYQPVSYNLTSRSGNRAQFIDMVERCNAVNVRVYVDAVINHMAAVSDDLNNAAYSFPKVPYTSDDFNVPLGKCPNPAGLVTNYSIADEVRYCNLLSLADIYFGEENNNRGLTKVVTYMNDLIGIGVAGFRIDAAKHMVPGDLVNVTDLLDDCQFGGRPYVFQEVIDRFSNEAISPVEYFASGDVTEFKYCDQMANFGRGVTPAKEFKTIGFDAKWGMIPDANALAFVENHDNQRNHGGGGDILSFQEPMPYKKATSFVLAWPYGTVRIMSSYYFTNTDQGPPSDDSGHTDEVIINSRGMCDNGWVCEHRWMQIHHMVCIRNIAGDAPVENWYDNGDSFIAFSRGDKVFFALNNEAIALTVELQTGLAEGTYCDLISGGPTDEGCSGTSVTIGSDGMAEIYLEPSHVDYDGILALTPEAMSGAGEFVGCVAVAGATALNAHLSWLISILLAAIFLKY